MKIGSLPPGETATSGSTGPGSSETLGSALRIARTVRRLCSAASGVRDDREPISAKLERWQSLEAPELPEWARDLRAHDPRWSSLFEDEARRLRAALGARVLDLQHIGSSAIPGLRSKPVLDLALTLAGSPAAPGVGEALATLGYRHYGPSPCDREAAWYWGPLEPPALVVIHAVERGNPWPGIAMAFRDRLRENGEERSLYERRKRELAERPGVTLLEYSLGKLALFYEISARATADSE